MIVTNLPIAKDGEEVTKSEIKQKIKKNDEKHGNIGMVKREWHKLNLLAVQINIQRKLLSVNLFEGKLSEIKSEERLFLFLN